MIGEIIDEELEEYEHAGVNVFDFRYTVKSNGIEFLKLTHPLWAVNWCKNQTKFVYSMKQVNFLIVKTMCIINWFKRNILSI